MRFATAQRLVSRGPRVTVRLFVCHPTHPTKSGRNYQRRPPSRALPERWSVMDRAEGFALRRWNFRPSQPNVRARPASACAAYAEVALARTSLVRSCRRLSLLGSSRGARRLPPAASAPAVPAGTVKVPVGACCSSPARAARLPPPRRAEGLGAGRGARGGTTSFTGALPRVAALPFARAAGRAVRVPRSSVRAAAARPKRDAVRAAGCTQSRRRGATGATRLGSAGWDPHGSDLVLQNPFNSLSDFSHPSALILGALYVARAG